MDCQIRNATTDDAAAISEVVVSALRESNGQDYPPDIIERVEQSFSPQAILNLLVQRQIYVATVDAYVVATASLDRDIVRSVFVAPAYQGAGIGKQLIAMIQLVAANEGVSLLRVPSSITAEGFYASLGFKQVRDEFHGAERTIIMEKRLDQ
ncbi:MAG: GNAT family N-acetyltransferase [Gammaproteobacteria bacterium]|nr:GNAT family N-acetyltransferase [Gammaproteobacteria bacterium]MBU1489988.1 GNAT family N-acetyltransferase [Gammaproteobacteria bacterium]MBU2064249.1 GNAT family N-acetyltransferase [Gammaproteobacteria bacterium]MBU2137886.1 GNAT family N-acetyltransferase [Gammaproteobacteria bacterium]MBU2325575.1 GNAT family N-acetyltransferase [Gammaproteobacteria bacterium]